MKQVRNIELLAPAKNLACAMAAIDHGADAVYIGAPRFGARVAAGNSLEDIETIVNYAHIYNVRVYVTINTLLNDAQLKEAEALIWQLYRIGVDAIIVQDLGITQLNLPPIPLHASTQMDNRTPQKVAFLAQAGFKQVVLARELSLDDIRAIHQESPQTLLEVFVHGALCVSYSGQCYISQACFGRSANRGECAQFCRLAFNMVDADGKLIAKNKHLLSLKDLNQLDNLEQLLDAGASSFKIEGRLKDAEYVKNVTAAYRKQLDAIFRRRPEYRRSSSGKSTYTFTPQVDKSFNRGFTNFFINGRQQGIEAFDTPKSLGEFVGTLKDQRGGCLTVAGVKSFHNGDGLCFVDEYGRLQGFRINRVEGNKLFPAGQIPRIPLRTPIYRNYDQEFERLLARPSAERRIHIAWRLSQMSWGFALTATDEDDNTVTLTFPAEKQLARTPQKPNLCALLCKLGNTPFEAKPEEVEIAYDEEWFLPASLVAEWRRQVVEKLLALRRINYRQPLQRITPTTHAFVSQQLTYLGNVMNAQSQAFYAQHGVAEIAPAYEQQPPESVPLMFCRHCLRYSMGWCPQQHAARSPYREPYYLVSTDGNRFRLQFDCKHCQMLVFKE